MVVIDPFFHLRWRVAAMHTITVQEFIDSIPALANDATDAEQTAHAELLNRWFPRTSDARNYIQWLVCDKLQLSASDARIPRRWANWLLTRAGKLTNDLSTLNRDLRGGEVGKKEDLKETLFFEEDDDDPTVVGYILTYAGAANAPPVSAGTP